jgi:hypothetical protein
MRSDLAQNLFWEKSLPIVLPLVQQFKQPVLYFFLAHASLSTAKPNLALNRSAVINLFHCLFPAFRARLAPRWAS